MTDPRMNNILKWGIQNSEASRNDGTATDQPAAQLDPKALQELLTGMAGPSDAELMKESMNVIDNPEASSEAKYIAFENFEMLIEGIDNANNIEALGLWTRLLKHLESDDQKIQFYAAWCCGVAVQNNIRAQERVSSSFPATSFRHADIFSFWCLTPHPHLYNWQPETATRKRRRRPSMLCRPSSGISSRASMPHFHMSQRTSSQKANLMRTTWHRSIC